MVTIDYDRCCLVVKMPYHGGCVNMLKAVLPQHARRWDPDNKCWYVVTGYCLRLLKVLRLYFNDADIFVSPAIPQYSSLRDLLETEYGFPPKLAGPYSELYLTPNAPPELVKVAYKTLAKIYHPDHGGDEERMKRINKAYESISGN